MGESLFFVRKYPYSVASDDIDDSITEKALTFLNTSNESIVNSSEPAKITKIRHELRRIRVNLLRSLMRIGSIQENIGRQALSRLDVSEKHFLLILKWVIL